MRKPSQRKVQRPGISFEEAVAAIQGLLDPKATVVHNQRLVDRIGHRRQFDVVIRAKAAGHDVLGVIECKDLNRPVDSPEINAFADKARNVNANVLLMMSRRGFTKPALELARFHGIGAFSLLKADHNQKGLTFGTLWYTTVYSWNTLQITLHYDGPVVVSTFSAETIEIGGKPFLPWALNQLYTTHDITSGPGWYRLAVEFMAPTAVQVEGTQVQLLRIHVNAERLAKYKKKRILWAGTALYDWDKKQFTIPGNASMVTQGWRGDFSDWDDFEGPLPPEMGGGFVEARFIVTTHPDPLPTSDLTFEGLAAVTFEPTP